MNTTLKFPFYAKLCFTLVSLVAIFYILYIAQGIIIPLMMAMLFAILLRPVVTFFKRMKFPHILAVIMSVLLFVLFIGTIIWFISWQLTDVADDWGKIKRNFTIHIFHIQQYISTHFGISMDQQQAYLNTATKDGLKSSGKILGTTLMSFTDVLVNLTLVPIYMFLILLYRNHFMKFLCKLFHKDHHPKLMEILDQVKVSVKSYLVGLSLELIIVSVLTAVGLLIVDVEYAILLGVITGILNLIPYIGIMVACLISILASLTSSPDLSIVVGVIVVNLVVQLIDNNILVPMVVSSKVEINALVSIFGIIVGGAVAGVPGMFLAIPLIAILKVIFDRIAPLEPWGYLMGDDLPKTFEWRGMRLPHYNFESSRDALLNVAEPDDTYTEPVEEQIQGQV